MNENREIPASAGADSQKPAPVRLTWRQWLGLGLGLCLAALWFAVFGLDALYNRRFAPSGLGTTLFVFALFAVTLIHLGKRAVWNRVTVLLLAACLLLGVSCFLFSSPRMAFLNCCLILCAGTLEIFALAGRLPVSIAQARVIPAAVSMGFSALFKYWPLPFRALGALGGGDKKRVALVVVGVVVAVPVLALVIYLLASADAVFGSIFKGLGQWFSGIGVGSIIWRVVRVVVLGLMFFSALYYLSQPGRAAAGENERRGLPASPFITALVLLDIVYAVFVFIQLRFLFGGTETAAMSGGYAEYARTGFFQLVAVAVINLAAVLVSAVATKPEGAAKIALRTLSALLLGFTGVILASALYRMLLYISAYGLSFLRAMTLWGMAFIAVLLIAAAIKVFLPQKRFWPVFLAVGLAGWILFAFINVDARIAEYNVNAYLSGGLEEIDTEYLASLSTDTAGALERLRAAKGGDFSCYGQRELDIILAELYGNLDDSRSWRDATLQTLKYAWR